MGIDFRTVAAALVILLIVQRVGLWGTAHRMIGTAGSSTETP